MRRPSALRWSGCKTFEGVLNYSRNAEVAQLVEHHLAMVRVAGSNPVFRSDPGPEAPVPWRHGRVVRQGSAKPCTPVRFRVSPLGRGVQTGD